MSFFFDDIFFITKMNHSKFISFFFEVVTVYLFNYISSYQIWTLALFKVKAISIKTHNILISFRFLLSSLYFWSMSLKSISLWHENWIYSCSIFISLDWSLDHHEFLNANFLVSSSWIYTFTIDIISWCA